MYNCKPSGHILNGSNVIEAVLPVSSPADVYDFTVNL